MSTVQSSQAHDGSTRSRFAAGVAQFAGVMLSIVGVLEILQGIAAIANDTVFVRGLSYTYEFDVTAWGWIHVVVGVLAVAVGIAIVAGQTVGYLGGVAVGFLAAVANFAFMPYYPVWSLVLIAFNVLVIWALCIQLGRDRVTEDYYDTADTPTGPSTGTPSSMPR